MCVCVRHIVVNLSKHTVRSHLAPCQHLASIALHEHWLSLFPTCYPRYHQRLSLLPAARSQIHKSSSSARVISLPVTEITSLSSPIFFSRYGPPDMDGAPITWYFYVDHICLILTLSKKWSFLLTVSPTCTSTEGCFSSVCLFLSSTSFFIPFTSHPAFLFQPLYMFGLPLHVFNCCRGSRQLNVELNLRLIPEQMYMRGN